MTNKVHQSRFGVIALGLLFVSVASNLTAQDLWVTNRAEFPGRLRISESFLTPRVVLSRADRPNPAYPNAVMKVGHIALTIEQQVYYCSGLDGSLMHLLDGRHEIQVLEHPGQVRDLACTSEPHTIYYSVVETPQNGAALGDGYIYRRDFWEGSPTLVATIRQADVGGNWWGTFTIREDKIFLATLDPVSRIYRWAAGTVEPAFVNNRQTISGLSVDEDGDFLIANGTSEVLKTHDFENFTHRLRSDSPITDIATRANRDSRRP